jgi:7-cyano-7-deazaguanine synthase in queuosine biosynthesis
MSNLLRFPTLSYGYDFSTPKVVKCKNSILSEFSFYVRDEEILGLFGSEINSLHLDWIDIAIAVYVADRLSLREIEKYRNNWKRTFNLKIAVRNLETWLSQDVQAELKNVLNFYTDDDWEFEFVKLETDERMKAINNKLPLPPNEKPRVALFSGGLDSFAGAVQELFSDKESSFIFVSGRTNSRQEYLQKQQIKELREKYKNQEIIHHIIDFGFNWNGLPHPKEENSQRTRGFVFTTLGVVTALNAGINTLEIYENGIGAINLPYDKSQVGTMNSRGVNPLSLLRMERFIQTLTKQKFQIENLYLFETKGKMCRHQSVKGLADAISLTFSCDGFPVHTAGKSQCGVCTSCLLRRLSVEVADLNDFDDGENYLTDLGSLTFNPSFAQLNDLRVMEWQYQIIKNHLSAENPWQALVYEFPVLQSIVSEFDAYKNFQTEDIQNKILRLFSRYCEEWENFSARRNFINDKRKAA